METHIKQRKCSKCGYKHGFYVQERPRRNQQKLYWRIKKDGKWTWQLAGWYKDNSGNPGSIYDENWKKVTKPHAGRVVWIQMLVKTIEEEEE